MGGRVSGVGEGARTPPLCFPRPRPKAHRLFHVDHILGALALHLVVPDHRRPAQAVGRWVAWLGPGTTPPLVLSPPHAGPKASSPSRHAGHAPSRRGSQGGPGPRLAPSPGDPGAPRPGTASREDPAPRTPRAGNAPPFLLAPPRVLTPPLTLLRGGASLKDPALRDLRPYPQVLPCPTIRLRPYV